MASHRTLHVGFDPTFIDALLTPLNPDGMPLDCFPDPGTHHVHNELRMSVGGNGYNFARTLSQIGKSVTFVGPYDSMFETMHIAEGDRFKLRRLTLPQRTNWTIGVNLAAGEVQFNKADTSLTEADASEEVKQAFVQSPIKSLSNIGLNPQGPEWATALVKACPDPLTEHQVMYLDPSDLSAHKDLKARLRKLWSAIANLNRDNPCGLTSFLITVNEHEYHRLFDSSNDRSRIQNETNGMVVLHGAERVHTWFPNGKKQTFDVPKLDKRDHQLNFVGAGDAFNAILVAHLLKGNDSSAAVRDAIIGAKQFIEGAEILVD